MKVNWSDVKEDYQRLNNEISTLEQKLVEAESVLSKAGYRRCDCISCNCGSYHKAIKEGKDNGT